MSDLQLITQRLRLRRCIVGDIEWIHDLHSYPEVDQFNTLGIPKDLSETKTVMAPLFEEWNKQPIQRYTFSIECLSDDACIGLFGLNLSVAKYQSAELWYKFFPKHWGQGYATEAVARVLRFGFEDLNLHRITAGCAVDNLASIRVLEKVGMLKEGRFREVLPLKSGWSDNFEFAILEKDFL